MRIVRLKRGKPFQVIANVDILVLIGIIRRFCIQALKEIVILLAAIGKALGTRNTVGGS